MTIGGLMTDLGLTPNTPFLCQMNINWCFMIVTGIHVSSHKQHKKNDYVN